jgi:hypothetical protein
VKLIIRATIFLGGKDPSCALLSIYIMKAAYFLYFLTVLLLRGEAARTSKGRGRGSTFNPAEIDTLLSLVEENLPLGPGNII